MFAAIAYDAIKIVAAAIKQGGPYCKGIHNALGQLKQCRAYLWQSDIQRQPAGLESFSK